jgi:hypothetical protein
MLRRSVFTTATCAAAPTTMAVAVPRVTTRGYFMSGLGDTGIWGASMHKLINTLTFLTLIVGPIFIYRITYRPYNPDKQFGPAMHTDKWYDDGTVMKGEEATANLRLQRERLMPIMDAYLEKIEASKGGNGGGADHGHGHGHDHGHAAAHH